MLKLSDEEIFRIAGDLLDGPAQFPAMRDGEDIDPHDTRERVSALIGENVDILGVAYNGPDNEMSVTLVITEAE